jgi:hypothetical protein
MSERLISTYRGVLACLDPRSDSDASQALRMARTTVEQAGGFDAQLADLVTDETLARLAPVLHAHINPYGRYLFDLAAVPALGHLRPLNTIAARVDSDVPTTPIPVNRD